MGGLGFRSFDNFNKAMLGKQWWRLMTRSESLMAKIIKVRYYPKCALDEANRGTNSSFLWKSLHSTRDMMNKGIPWKVGDGQNINIWSDAWVPGFNSEKVQTIRREGQGIMKVSHLIHPHGRTWNETLIRATFVPMDADKILQIPLSNEHRGDKLIWKDNVNGMYSVKGGYKILQGPLREPAEAGPSN